jgi:Flp pilus assembly pilin Flp
MLDTTPLLMLAITVHQAGDHAQQRFIDAAKHLIDHHRNALTDDRGQATTEYALVLLAAALVALLVVAWATAGGGAAKIGRLFNRVIDSVIDKV